MADDGVRSCRDCGWYEGRGHEAWCRADPATAYEPRPRPPLRKSGGDFRNPRPRPLARPQPYRTRDQEMARLISNALWNVMVACVTRHETSGDRWWFDLADQLAGVRAVLDLRVHPEDRVNEAPKNEP